MSTKSTIEKKFTVLKWAHRAAAVIHLGSSGFLLGYAADGNNWTPPLEISHDRWVDLTGCENNLNSRCFRQERQIDTYGIDLAWLCATFALWSGLLHFLIGFVPSITAKYRKSVEQRFGFWRWLDYTVSASIMIVVIAIYCGIVDTFTLALLGLVEGTVILVGAASEWALAQYALRLNALPVLTSWQKLFGTALELKNGFFILARGLLYIAFVIFFLLWVPILTTFFLSLEGAEEVPFIVYVVVMSYPISFLFFGLILLQIYRKRTENYLWYEFNFVLLSLVSKVLLHWSIFFGLLVRGESLENAEFERKAPGSVDENSLYGVIGGALLGGILISVIAAHYWPSSKKEKVEGINMKAVASTYSFL